MSKASLYDFRDLDLMIKLADAATGENGDVSATELAEAMGFEEAKTLSSRLSWMRRYGMLRYDDNRRTWGLTRGGEKVVETKLKAAQERAITSIPDEALAIVMSHVTTRFRMGDPMVAQVLRREFLYGTKPR